MRCTKHRLFLLLVFPVQDKSLMTNFIMLFPLKNNLYFPCNISMLSIILKINSTWFKLAQMLSAYLTTLTRSVVLAYFSLSSIKVQYCILIFQTFTLARWTFIQLLLSFFYELICKFRYVFFMENMFVWIKKETTPFEWRIKHL